jgi:hypothetical protein
MGRSKRGSVDRTPGPYTPAFTPDVLVIEIPLMTARYPSRNAEVSGSQNYGTKSPEYAKLFATVCAAAEDAVARGWQMVDLPCDFTVTRIVPDFRVRDAMNLGGTEANGLTRGRVWADDTLGTPAHVDVQVNPGGDDRVIIIVRRMFERPGRPRAPRSVQERRPRGRRRASAEDSLPLTVRAGEQR